MSRPETLTPAGARWAWNNTESMVARVALAGAGAWPASHVAAAVVACNTAGARLASCPAAAPGCNPMNLQWPARLS